jgi:hypothetical protein
MEGLMLAVPKELGAALTSAAYTPVQKLLLQEQNNKPKFVNEV